MAFRNDDLDAEADVNGPGRDGYTDGVPGVLAPTPHRAADLNMAQEEICRTVEGLGLALSSDQAGARQKQLLQGLLTEIVGDAIGRSIIRTPTSNTYWRGGAISHGAVPTAIVVGGETSCAIASSTGLALGRTWTARTPAASQPAHGAAWSPSVGRFVAVGAAASIQSSTDGIVWNLRTAGGTITDFRDVIWVETLGLFVAVGQAAIETSPDGITWTARTPAGSGHFRSVTWSETLGLLCAVGDAGVIETSPDAITWTARTPDAAYTGDFSSVAWSELEGTFVAGATGVASTDLLCQTSPDGITWTEHAVGTVLAPDDQILYVEEYKDVFVAASNFYRFVSADGATWFVCGSYLGLGDAEYNDIQHIVPLRNSVLFVGDSALVESGRLRA